MGHWILGDEAVGRVAPIALKYVRLNKSGREAVCETVFPSYSPWLMVPATPQETHRLLAVWEGTEKGDLVTNGKALAAIAQVLSLPGEHAVARIVPADIQVTIDVELEQNNASAQLAVSSARRLLATAAPWLGTLYDNLIHCVVPIIHRREGRPTKRGFSSPFAYGAIFLTFEDREYSPAFRDAELAIDLAHELGHHVLYAYQAADPILRNDLERAVYSGVRKIQRPAIMSVHAAIALAYMIAAGRDILRCTTESNLRVLLEQRTLDRINDQRRGLMELRKHCEFTEFGEAIMREMEWQLEA